MKKEKKGFWQFIKFMLVSGAVCVVQLVLANTLPFLFDGLKDPIPELLTHVFDPDMLFNRQTEDGAADYAKYVVNGVVTWGYVLPFFLSNFIANIYGYFQNRKTTFKSNSSPLNVLYYFILLTVLILFTTWLQGVIVGKLNSTGNGLLITLARTIAAMAAGAVQTLVIFPMEKFVLMKEPKKKEK